LEAIGGRLLSKTEKEQRNQLIAEINRKGFSQVMEEAAYGNLSDEHVYRL